MVLIDAPMKSYAWAAARNVTAITKCREQAIGIGKAKSGGRGPEMRCMAAFEQELAVPIAD